MINNEQELNGELIETQSLEGEILARGPKGDTGATGETGATGPQGIPGQDGRDGVVQYTAGENITIENNVISSTGGISNIDNITITENADEEIQTIAVLDSKTNGANKFWTGTSAEYNAIATKDANTFYYITDDNVTNNYRTSPNVINNGDANWITIEALTGNKVYVCSELHSIIMGEITDFHEETVMYFYSSADYPTTLEMELQVDGITHIGDVPIINSAYSGVCEGDKHYIVSFLHKIVVWKAY